MALSGNDGFEQRGDTLQIRVQGAQVHGLTECRFCARQAGSDGCRHPCVPSANGAQIDVMTMRNR